MPRIDYYTVNPRLARNSAPQGVRIGCRDPCESATDQSLLLQPNMEYWSPKMLTIFCLTVLAG